MDLTTSTTSTVCYDFNLVYHVNRDTVFGIAYSYTKSNADSNDILQDVFIKYYVSNKVFEDEEHVRAWLIRVTINACKTYLMSSWVKRTAPLDEAIPFEDKESSELYEAVMVLPRKYRVVIHLYYYEGYSVLEIASILNSKESTIKVRLMRARNLLKVNLKEEWEDEE